MKCILLCAGMGTRLGALTTAKPKALLDVAGKPLIAHSLEWLSREGITEVLINLHYLPDAIPAVIKDGADFGLTVSYVYEPHLLGTAGTVREARDWVAGDDALVVYGDVLTDQPLIDMREQHRVTGADGSLLVHRRAGSNSVVTMDSSRRITSFSERPGSTSGFPQETWVNSGVQLLSQRLIRSLPPSVPLDLPRDIYQTGPGLGLFGFPCTGWRIAVDSPERLQEASKYLSQTAETESHGTD